MKNTSKKPDAMRDALNSKNYKILRAESSVRLKFAVEVYDARIKLGFTQSQLAKMVSTTQKVISKIENAEVNLGIHLIKRVADSLNFTSDNLARVFNRPFIASLIVSTDVTESSTQSNFAASEIIYSTNIQ